MHSIGKRDILGVVRLLYTSSSLISRFRNPLASTFATKCSTLCLNEADSVNNEKGVKERPNLTPLDVLRKWGCNDDEISQLFTRNPALQRGNTCQLEFKLSLLTPLGITSSDLVKILNVRPRLFSHHIHLVLDERIKYLIEFLGSKEVLPKVILRNPSLMCYDLNEKIKPVIDFYKGLGISQEDVVSMLRLRPMLIPRTSFNKEKFEYIEKTGLTKDSKLFKYIASIIGISRVETIQEKVANLEKYGLSEEEVWHLFGKSPYILTLSVEKVQRNMTFIIASTKLPAQTVLDYPCLLLANLETNIRPRVNVVKRVFELGLKPLVEGVSITTVLRMTEKRFLKVYVNCHPQEVAAELMEVYEKAKNRKRLAVESKIFVCRGFPF